MLNTHKVKPKRVRPQIKPPTGDRFWQYCQQHHLLMDATVTALIAQWLDEQEQSKGEAA